MIHIVALCVRWLVMNDVFDRNLPHWFEALFDRNSVIWQKFLVLTEISCSDKKMFPNMWGWYLVEILLLCVGNIIENTDLIENILIWQKFQAWWKISIDGNSQLGSQYVFNKLFWIVFCWNNTLVRDLVKIKCFDRNCWCWQNLVVRIKWCSQTCVDNISLTCYCYALAI